MADLIFTSTTSFLDTKENSNERGNYSYIQKMATVYAQAIIDWTISLRRLARQPSRGNYQLQIFSRSHHLMINHRNASCLIALVKCNKDDSQETLAEMNVRGELDGALNVKFVIQGNNEFTQALKENLTGSKRSIRLTLKLKLPKAAFEAESWAAPIPTTPLQRDYTFDCIDNPELLDLKLICRDGEFQMNKAALWRCAPGLRKIVEMTDDTLDVDVSLQTAKTVVTYMISHTFLAPPEINKKLLIEATSWIRACIVAEKANILTAYENFACMQIENMPLDNLLELLLTAMELRLDRLEMGLSAVIIRNHFVDMKNKYGKELTDSQIGSKLKTRTAHRGHSPMTKLEQMWKDQQHVYLVEASPAK